MKSSLIGPHEGAAQPNETIRRPGQSTHFEPDTRALTLPFADDDKGLLADRDMTGQRPQTESKAPAFLDHEENPAWMKGGEAQVGRHGAEHQPFPKRSIERNHPGERIRVMAERSEDPSGALENPITPAEIHGVGVEREAPRYLHRRRAGRPFAVVRAVCALDSPQESTNAVIARRTKQEHADRRDQAGEGSARCTQAAGRDTSRLGCLGGMLNSAGGRHAMARMTWPICVMFNMSRL